MHREETQTLIPPGRPRSRALRIGIGGPVGGGKTALVAALCRALAAELSVVVVTNDIYTPEDADFLRRNGVLADERRGTGNATGRFREVDELAELTHLAEDRMRVTRDHSELDVVGVEQG